MEKKYVIRADGSVRVFDRTGIHAWNECGCPEKDCGGRAVSAGFCSRENGEVKVWGESTTLRLKSRPEDAALIEEALKKEVMEGTEIKP